MITYEDIVDTLGPDINEAEANKVIERVKGFIIDYTNNSEIFVADVDGKITNPVSIDDVMLYLACERLNPETKHKAGKQSENIGGVSITFATDLPGEVKVILNKYRRAKTI